MALAKYWSPITEEHFYKKMDLPIVREATAYIPKEVYDSIVINDNFINGASMVYQKGHVTKKRYE